MRNLKAKRFGIHEIAEGRHRGSFHVRTQNYDKFATTLYALSNYLERRILPVEPEEAHMKSILLSFHNILEYEMESVIRVHAKDNKSDKNTNFVKKMEEGYKGFKSKYKFLNNEGLITDDEGKILEEIRVLRNAHVHLKPRAKRKKFKYFDASLMTLAVLRQMFVGVEKILKKLRQLSVNKEIWSVLPPGYAKEMGWA